MHVRTYAHIDTYVWKQTIDNDVDLIDRSFGFTTSVEAAQAAIVSAKTEARCNLPNGIGEIGREGGLEGGRVRGREG